MDSDTKDDGATGLPCATAYSGAFGGKDTNCYSGGRHHGGDIAGSSWLCVTTGFEHADTLVRDGSHVVQTHGSGP